MTHISTPWIENEQLRHDGTAAGTGYDIWTNSEQAHYVGSATRREDARLIAAAPAMLIALRLCMRYINGGHDLYPGLHHEAYIAARDAINAATGKH